MRHFSLFKRLRKQHLKDAAVRFVAIWMIIFVFALGYMPTRAQESGGSKPNFVVIMTDDMSENQLNYMPNIKKFLINRGLSFNNFVINYPLCCPSRATLLTGQYDHNNGVRDNFAPDGAFASFKRINQSTILPSKLKNAGYNTIFAGKYFNGYQANDGVMPGWTDWNGYSAGSSMGYYNYTLNSNGSIEPHGSRTQDYSTDVLRDKVTNSIKRLNRQSDKPFFALFAPFAPHIVGGGETARPPVPAPRHQGIYNNVQLPKPPNFMEQDVSDKPNIVSNKPTTNMAFNGYTMDQVYRKEIESLRAVDDAFKEIFDTTIRAGEFDNTYFMFYSDNGFSHGEHRLTHGKNMPYEELINVPLIMRGPGIPQNRKVNNLTANIDLASTIYDLARVTPGRLQDGHSLKKYFGNPNAVDNRPVLIRGRWNQESNSYGFKGLRTNQYTYVEWASGQRELYDLQTDPFQLQSLHNDPNYSVIKNKLANHLQQTNNCEGAECRVPLAP